MSESDAVRLRHILDAAEEAVAIAGGRPRAELIVDRTAVLAVMKDIEIMGEAASKLSAEFRELNPSVPWGDIIGMRNWLVHGYFDVNLDIVWETVEQDLPLLIGHVRPLLARP